MGAGGLDPEARATAQLSVGWGEGWPAAGHPRLRHSGRPVWKSCRWGGLSAARGFGHPRRNPIKGSGGTGEGGNANQFFEAPPSCGFQGVELGLNILDPPPGAEGRAGRGSAFGNDSRFPVWFLSRGPWNTLTPVICVHSTTLPFTQLFFFFLFATFPLLRFVHISVVVVVKLCEAEQSGKSLPLWEKCTEKESWEVERGQDLWLQILVL